MKNTIILFASIAVIGCTSPKNNSTQSTDTSEVPETSIGVSFANIENGTTLSSPFYLEMGVAGMEVEPKGQPREGYGHHHLLINDGTTPAGTVIVADDTHIHYGGGQISDSVSLAPGEYKLTLQFADGMHVSYGEKWAKSINITVK